MKPPTEGWCNVYPDGLPSAWHRNRDVADRMSAKHRVAVIHLRWDGSGYVCEMIPTRKAS